jgi:hypothetical protein
VPDINTADDLYFAISQLVAQHRETARPLEEYLRALWAVSLRHRDEKSLTPNEFFGVLAEAFAAEPFPSEPELWLEAYGDIYELGLENAPGYEGWEFRVRRQVIDLLEMDLSGQLADEQRYLGINAPRGSRWYNFDPCSFLECAAAGTLGGRELHGIDRDNPVLTDISWEEFHDFLGEGQWYE